MKSFKKNAKIIATLGPASSSVEIIEDLIRAGMNVARLNMGHGTREDHEQLIHNTRKASRNLKREVAILQDLQGPKIRVDKLQQPLKLGEGETWVIGHSKALANYPEYKDCFIPTTYEKLVSDSNIGDRLLFDNGQIVVKAVDKGTDILKIKVEVEGTLSSNKGISLPDTIVSAPSINKKDRQDLEFGLEHNVDYVALPFVRTKEDVEALKTIIRVNNRSIPVVSRIENSQGIENIDELIKASDAIMIARGDMAVEMGNHVVPTIQKEIIRKCNLAGVPVITATQMMESMVFNPIPTRAEASDVANAIWDGTGALMLSTETASGKYPVETVVMMDKIIEEAEKTPSERPLLRDIDLKHINLATVVAASMIAEKVGARRILVVTETGNSCLQIMRFRPTTKVLGITTHKAVMRRMCLYWGVSPFYVGNYDRNDEDIEFNVLNTVAKECNLRSGDHVVIVRGEDEFFKSGRANVVKTETY
ncbi:MAG: pyruvate kinase [Bacteriovoracaceae bacterium]|nr:pyruvate kinase [Bacteriovoracaceae bacterium]